MFFHMKKSTVAGINKTA